MLVQMRANATSKAIQKSIFQTLASIYIMFLNNSVSLWLLAALHVPDIQTVEAQSETNV